MKKKPIPFKSKQYPNDLMSKDEMTASVKSFLAHANALERETELLVNAGYFDPDGKPRKDAEGKKIWADVQRRLETEGKQIWHD